MTGPYEAAKQLLFRLDPEWTHDVAIAGLSRASRSDSSLKAIRRFAGDEDPRLGVELFGRPLANPLIVAAGLDKNGRAVPALNALGFGLVEIGTVTPLPQTGNPKPRVFRLPADGGLINRMGFPGEGAARVADHLLAARPGTFAINVGPNAERVDEAANECIAVIRRVALLRPRYIAINVSSPNTARLRALQQKHALTELLAAVQGGMPAAARGVPLLVKVSPDLSEAELDKLVQTLVDARVTGVIATNTTVSRPLGLRSSSAGETGGLSGRPLTALSAGMVARIARAVDGTLTVIAAGGIGSGADVARVMSLGADAVQIYTGFVFNGPGTARRIKRDLIEMMEREGVADLSSLIESHRLERREWPLTRELPNRRV